MTVKRTNLLKGPRTRRRLVVGLVAVAILALLAGMVGAQSSDKYNLSWYSMDGGSGVVTSDQYGLVTTVGESLGGLATGENFGMVGGYDSGLMEEVYYHFYLPIVIRTIP